MKLLFIISLSILMLGIATYANDQDNIFQKIINKIEKSEIEELTSRKFKNGESYQLIKASILNVHSSHIDQYIVIHLKYLRSSPPKQKTPPARGHDFITILDTNYEILVHRRVESGTYTMTQKKLLHETSEAFNFSGHTSTSLKHEFKIQ